MKVTARDIENLLASKHSNDVFVPECKDGPSQGTNHSRLDGWAMKRSWTKPYVTGYEIKVYRSDFLNDNKWPNYLDMCNALYFVCPTGLIEPSEVPETCGLMWASKNAARLYTKKKAPYREVEIPESVWRYILMCRAQITRERQHGGRREFWENWLKRKIIDQNFGWHVASSLRKRIKEEILDARNENERLCQRMEQYDGIREFLESIGVDPDNRFKLDRWNVERQLKKLRTAIPDGLISDLERLSIDATRTSVKLKQIADVKEQK